MKIKHLFALLAAALVSLTAAAKGTYTTDAAVLPAAATSQLDTHFKGKKIHHIKVEKDIMGTKGYDVTLTDGTEIDFDSKGNLKEVDCGKDAKVPDTLIMKSIRDYVKTNYKGQKIVQYEVKRHGYEIELQNGVELEFNDAGAFTRISR